MNWQLETHLGRLALPFAIDDCLSATPNRQILVINAVDSTAASSIEQFVDIIARYDKLSINAHDIDGASNDGQLSKKRDAVKFVTGIAQASNFDSDSFDLLICPFHSARAEIKKEMLQEFGRLLRSRGQLLIIDNLVPGSTLRGKKASQLRAAGQYVNAWMRLWNSIHKNYLSQDTWVQLLIESQWHIQHMLTCKISQDFDEWVDRYSPGQENRVRLQAMLVQAPEKVHGFLTPVETGDRIAFHTTEIFILATMAGDSE
jgi:hypothetical protein